MTLVLMHVDYVKGELQVLLYVWAPSRNIDSWAFAPLEKLCVSKVY